MSGRGRRPSRSAAIRRVLGWGASRASTSARDDGRVRGQRGQAGAALEDLLAEPGPERAQQARRIAPADAEDDDRARQRREGAEPEHLVAHEERAGRQEQDARQDRPELVRDAVVEGQDLGPTLGRDDVVERAPGGVRQPALGDLLGEPDDRRGGEREA